MNIRGIAYGVITFVLVYFSTSQALAAEYYMPTAGHYQAEAEGRSCSIFRSLHKDAQSKIDENQKAMKQHIFSLKDARDRLEACARERGVAVSSNGDSKEEVLIAELCPSLYKAWLTPSYRVKMVAQDLEEAYQTSRVTSTQLKLRCRSLPAGEKEARRMGADDLATF